MIKEITDRQCPADRGGGLEHVRRQNHYPLTPVSSTGRALTLSPREEGFTKIKATKEKTMKDQTHKAIRAKPKFQQVNQGDGE